ncbi:MAG TPA: hypothetical protein VIW19_11090 [Gaiellaceae bacterium]
MDEIVQLLRQAKGMLERAERLALERARLGATDSARTSNGLEDPQSPASWLRFLRFLRAVEKEGVDGVDANRQRELMAAAGYPDNRAAGGFFGGNKPSLLRDPDTDQRYLTDEGRRLIEEGRLRFGADIDELPPSAAKERRA